ncbi:MAG TPA: hypothetical protein PK263_00635 [bacterium]|nr:hypothetical protein [bacterium]
MKLSSIHAGAEGAKGMAGPKKNVAITPFLLLWIVGTDFSTLTLGMQGVGGK